MYVDYIMEGSCIGIPYFLFHFSPLSMFVIEQVLNSTPILLKESDLIILIWQAQDLFAFPHRW